ncbi:DUF397 domain-containing protein [Streptomyces sparsogenes]|uniref:DUF397 domain-containing protein n=1 Tax=Streptomyces sparsogenes DSM 40356 TaxID=1331668 RepID=A0A1R1S706_9ACTN|nr:DUF397 domain-containing protein [Streptomyces sparsogenes]OMI34064.1 hypothetical protein SPAR_38295 [Streptomyces sparsogenes DSM 40356]
MRESLKWQKSSYSGAGGENCVELARRAVTTLIRESDDPHVVLATTPKRLAAFIAAAKAGAFDHLTP